MSKQAHTPGPWHIIGGYNIYSELGGQSGDGVQADPRDGWHVASIGEAPTFVNDESVYLGRDVQKANARLICAAPDILEALAAIVLEGGSFHFTHELHAKARAAIAKARGES